MFKFDNTDNLVSFFGDRETNNNYSFLKSIYNQVLYSPTVLTNLVEGFNGFLAKNLLTDEEFNAVRESYNKRRRFYNGLINYYRRDKTITDKATNLLAGILNFSSDILQTASMGVVATMIPETLPPIIGSMLEGGIGFGVADVLSETSNLLSDRMHDDYIPVKEYINSNILKDMLVGSVIGGAFNVLSNMFLKYKTYKINKKKNATIFNKNQNINKNAFSEYFYFDRIKDIKDPRKIEFFYREHFDKALDSKFLNDIADDILKKKKVNLSKQDIINHLYADYLQRYYDDVFNSLPFLDYEKNTQIRNFRKSLDDFLDTIKNTKNLNKNDFIKINFLYKNINKMMKKIKNIQHEDLKTHFLDRLINTFSDKKDLVDKLTRYKQSLEDKLKKMTDSVYNDSFFVKTKKTLDIYKDKYKNNSVLFFDDINAYIREPHEFFSIDKKNLEHSIDNINFNISHPIMNNDIIKNVKRILDLGFPKEIDVKKNKELFSEIKKSIDYLDKSINLLTKRIDKTITPKTLNELFFLSHYKDLLKEHLDYLSNVDLTQKVKTNKIKEEYIKTSDIPGKIKKTVKYTKKEKDFFMKQYFKNDVDLKNFKYRPHLIKSMYKFIECVIKGL